MSLENDSALLGFGLTAATGDTLHLEMQSAASPGPLCKGQTPAATQAQDWKCSGMRETRGTGASIHALRTAARTSLPGADLAAAIPDSPGHFQTAWRPSGLG